MMSLPFCAAPSLLGVSQPTPKPVPAHDRPHHPLWERRLGAVQVACPAGVNVSDPKHDVKLFGIHKAKKRSKKAAIVDNFFQSRLKQGQPLALRAANSRVPPGLHKNREKNSTIGQVIWSNRLIVSKKDRELEI